jgi:hypothetical protein
VKVVRRVLHAWLIFCKHFSLTVLGKSKVAPVLNQVPHHKDVLPLTCHEGVLGSGGLAQCILDLGSRWRWVVSFTPRSVVLVMNKF